MTIEALSLAIGSLQQNGAAMRALRTTCPPDWRKSYVALRRKTQVVVQDIADAGDACFKEGICRHLEGEFRNALNVMRATVAFHQANWPVVVVDPQNAEYCASVEGVMATVGVLGNVVARMVSGDRAAA